MGIWYATRESVKSALDSAETARNNAQVDRAIESASRSVDNLCHRVFYPQTATRYFPWPDRRRSRPWRLWLDHDELISVTTVTAGGVVIPSTDYFLEPANSGPPYTHVEIDLASNAAFAAGSTHQRAIEIAGVFGYRADEVTAGDLAEALDASETGVDVTDSSVIGVGDLIRVDSERMLVTGKAMLNTGFTTGGALTASNADVTVAVGDPSVWRVDETILVDSERMLVTDISGNNLTLRRAWDGSVLAAHNSGAIMYAPRTLTVTRGALGTTAAIHSTAADIVRHDWPGLVRDLTIAESLNTLQQESSGYARTIRSGEGSADAGGVGLEDLRSRCYRAHGRKARKGAI